MGWGQFVTLACACAVHGADGEAGGGPGGRGAAGAHGHAEAEDDRVRAAHARGHAAAPRQQRGGPAARGAQAAASRAAHHHSPHGESITPCFDSIFDASSVPHGRVFYYRRSRHGVACALHQSGAVQLVWVLTLGSTCALTIMITCCVSHIAVWSAPGPHSSMPVQAPRVYMYTSPET